MGRQTCWVVGDRVRARVDAQGLKRGATYVVREVAHDVRIGMDFVTYAVEHETTGARVAVGNGHLVLEEAS